MAELARIEPRLGRNSDGSLIQKCIAQISAFKQRVECRNLGKSTIELRRDEPGSIFTIDNNLLVDLLGKFVERGFQRHGFDIDRLGADLLDLRVGAGNRR